MNLTLCLWDVITREEILTLEGSAGSISQLALSPDGRLLACAAGDNAVRVWEAEPER